MLLMHATGPNPYAGFPSCPYHVHITNHLQAQRVLLHIQLIASAQPGTVLVKQLLG